MTIRFIAFHGVAVAAALSSSAGAQKPPAVRPLGRIERVSTDSLGSASAALAMPGGHVLVNDMTGRRVLLFDSTLSKPHIVADTTGATANAYGERAGTLIAYRGDSALYIDIASLSMLVITPNGAIARVMAIPRPDEAQNLIGNIFGTPGFDARGRLTYRGRGGGFGGAVMLCCLGSIRLPAPGQRDELLDPLVQQRPDSAYVVRVDLATRIVDTAVVYKIPKLTTSLKADDQGFVTSLQTTHELLPLIDEWAVLPDGSIAVVRGRDYHVDWLSPDGRWTSSPKMPFDWQHIDDDHKQALIDSAAKADQAELDDIAARNTARRASGGGGGNGGRGGSGGRAGSVGGGGGGGRGIPVIAGRPQLSELSDYTPPFTAGAVRPDADGNLWIRTSTIVKGQPVYDIVNRRGELADRVQLPAFRTIAGFAPGVVFMAVKDAAGIVHLERARVK